MAKPSKLAQSGLGVVKRDWSIPSASQEPGSSQPIYWPPTPPNPVQPAPRQLTGSEQRLKDIQDALTGYASVPPSRFTSQVQNKRASPSEKTPSAKRARQLPPDWHSNDTLSKPSLIRQPVANRKPVYENSTSLSSVKKIAPVFLSQEQTQILKLVQDGSSVFYTGSAGMWLAISWRLCMLKGCGKGTGKSVLLREIIKTLRKKYTHDAVAITASTGEVVFWVFLIIC